AERARRRTDGGRATAPREQGGEDEGMAGQDKVLLQLQRNGPTRLDNSQNTHLGRCSGWPNVSDLARPGLQATWAATARLAPYRCWTPCLAPSRQWCGE